MMCVQLEFIRRDLFQLLLNGQNGLPRRQVGPLRDPVDVRIDGYGRGAKGNVADHIGGFASNARQVLQGLRVVGNLSAMITKQQFAQLDDVVRFGVV